MTLAAHPETTEQRPLDREAFVAALRAQAPHYHDRHPFHVLMNNGQLTQRQIQGWVANRFYYQKIIPITTSAASVAGTGMCGTLGVSAPRIPSAT